jgi:hypothetical protein
MTDQGALQVACLSEMYTKTNIATGVVPPPSQLPIGPDFFSAFASLASSHRLLLLWLAQML